MKKVFLFVILLTIVSLSKLLAQNPEILWEKSFGGSNVDVPQSIQQTNDGGYIITGFSKSDDGDVKGSGTYDFWIVKLDRRADTLWCKVLGEADMDFAHAVQQTNDGGYIIAGSEKGGNNNHGYDDFWIVKLNEQGDTLWTKSLGGQYYDMANAIQQTNDGGYIIAGETKSTNGDVHGNHGDFDYWVVKLNEQGDTTWCRTYGGSDEDKAYAIKQLKSIQQHGCILYRMIYLLRLHISEKEK